MWDKNPGEQARTQCTGEFYIQKTLSEVVHSTNTPCMYSVTCNCLRESAVFDENSNRIAR